jgi:hypothetical protein
MNYLVKNVTTGEETLCEKVVVDNHDYYLSENPELDDYCSNPRTKEFFKVLDTMMIDGLNNNNNDDYTIIATNNPSLDLPQVLGEVEELAKSEHSYNHKSVQEIGFRLGFVMGYKQAKETYSYTKKDLIDFKQQAPLILEQMCAATDEELFDIWKEQRTITISVK